VQEVRRNVALAAAALAGAALATVLGRRRPLQPPPAEAPDQRAEELRRKLSEARMAAPDEDEFEAAGMGPETIVSDERRGPPPPERPASAEFEAMRRRVHEEGRAAAEEMRRSAE
jgi:hypothetical protein